MSLSFKDLLNIVFHIYSVTNTKLSVENEQGEQQRREASGGGQNTLEEKKIFYAEKVGALLTVVIKAQVFLGEIYWKSAPECLAVLCIHMYINVHMNVYISIVIIVKRESWRGQRGRT